MEIGFAVVNASFISERLLSVDELKMPVRKIGAAAGDIVDGVRPIEPAAAVDQVLAVPAVVHPVAAFGRLADMAGFDNFHRQPSAGGRRFALGALLDLDPERIERRRLPFQGFGQAARRARPAFDVVPIIFAQGVIQCLDSAVKHNRAGALVIVDQLPDRHADR
jgi:hypothetical protein